MTAKLFVFPLDFQMCQEATRCGRRHCGRHASDLPEPRGKASRGLEVRTTSAAACLHGRRKPTTSTQLDKRKTSLFRTCPRKAVHPKLRLVVRKGKC